MASGDSAKRSEPFRVCAVGPHDVDSFGDLLFLLITERYLPGSAVTAATPFPADLTKLIDRDVLASEQVLDQEAFDVIWTTGGEIGGMDLELVFRRVASVELEEQYDRATPAERDRMIAEMTAGNRAISPYIPSPLDYPRNAGAVTVLNSVGISHILGSALPHLPEVTPALRERLVALLRGTSLISVRDQQSSELLRGHGIEHRLVPDMVHALGIIRPAQRARDSDVAILQVWAQHVATVGVAKVADVVARCANLRGLRVRLLLAGKYEDQRPFNQALVDHIGRIAPEMDVEIIDDRHPLSLVDWISRARVVIDFCELHVRLVATTYNVPRVSVKDPDGPKTDRYARVWDPGMPFEVALDDLDASIAAALARADDPAVIERSDQVSRLAHENLEALAADALALAAEPGGRHERERARRAQG